MKKGNPIALLPIGVFLALYLGLGLWFEYGLKIPMGFYNIPIVIAFLVAILVACLQNKSLSFDKKLEIMGQGVGDKNIITMLLIFLAAGAFVGVVGRSSAQSVAYFMLSVIPPQFGVAVLFVVSCFISTAMGTSVGTITLLTPIAVEVATAAAFDPALCIATVVGGSMFGDNLSMISDTTIAAVRTQGCEMKDKFIMNFGIVLPAAIATLVILVIVTPAGNSMPELGEYNIFKVIPYLVVLIGALIGLNVFGVLMAGIVLSVIVGISTGMFPWTDIFNVTFKGISGMYDITVISIIVACIGALVSHGGGIQAIIDFIHARINTKKGAQLGIAALVAGVDIATANNTIAIVMAGPIAKDISDEFGIDPRRTASLLDIFASVVQGLIPYGAQLLYAVAGAASMGYTISSVRLLPYLYYPVLMCVCALVFIFFIPDKKSAK